MLICLHIVYGCFCTTKAEFNRCYKVKTPKGDTPPPPAMSHTLYSPLPWSVGRTCDLLPTNRLQQRLWDATPLIGLHYKTKVMGYCFLGYVALCKTV